MTKRAEAAAAQLLQDIPPARMSECEAALAEITQAPKNDAPIAQLCVRTGFSMRSFPLSAQLTQAEGIVGDRWLTHPWLKLKNGQPDPRIQVSIISQRVMDLCWRNRLSSPHPGDLFAVDMDLGEGNLPAGTRLRAGEVTLEVSDVFNTACVKWQRRYGDESLRWINMPKYRSLRLRGILCQVIEGGTIRVGDTLSKVFASESRG